MTADSIRVLAGECTVRFESDAPGDAREERGAVLVVAKPDGTVLVHDRDGYRPVAWLTRADSVAAGRTAEGPVIEATDGDRRLRVTCHAEYGDAHYAASHAGTPAGTCPDCGGSLVHAAGSVACLGCDAAYGVPRDAEVTGSTCPGCGLPTMRVERGATFECCVDRACDPLDDRVRERFDGRWSCPDCGGALSILRRGGLIAGCEGYPACDTGFSLPAGTVDGPCPECGLPVFETTGGRRCLDATCGGVDSVS